MKKFLLLFHTVRYLKPKQLAYQIIHRVRKPCVRNTTNFELRNVLNTLHTATFMQSATQDGKTFTFLDETGDLKGGWNNSSYSKLWIYNLHYQDDLNSLGSDERDFIGQSLVDEWIVANPPFQGNGWEPYCLSLRIVNWVKWLSRQEENTIKPVWLESLAIQADALEQQLEFHILANHLFANAKALVFVGVFFNGKSGNHWLKRGLQLLDEEIPEQFLSDGAHYELSPMYHAALLWDLCDLLALQQASNLPQLAARAKSWQHRLQKGIEWLQAMTHPDMDIAFFNDATIGTAPTLADLRAYAKRLGLKVPYQIAVVQLKAHLYKDSGYAVMDWPQKHRLIVDVAPVGPEYQPGHAHADTLSCELSLFGQRLLVNSGISQYGEGRERYRQRSTAAHNTLEIDSQDSSEVWSGFRVARRARPINIKLQNDLDKCFLKASHTGYWRLPGKVTHQRSWLAQKNTLTIEDKLNGHYSQAIVYWHFHPDVKIEVQNQHSIILTLPKGQQVNMQISGAEVLLLASTWHPRFGVSINNQRLKLVLKDSKLVTFIKWSIT
ncbi:alginate lyase family protein [Psychrobacter pacificensis]|uniref:heparinase II/III family protein n=1 Tax=Psychrobacter pacificensis TaxID=112002 RepID=UPI003D2B09D7